MCANEMLPVMGKDTVGEHLPLLWRSGRAEWGGVSGSQEEDLMSRADRNPPGRDWFVCLQDSTVILRKTREVKHTGPESVNAEGSRRMRIQSPMVPAVSIPVQILLAV